MSPREPTDTWTTLIDADPSATIRPGASEAHPDVVQSLLAQPDGRDELAFGDTIGTGGMGVVRAAEQVRMGRVVAVKSLRAGLGDPDATRRLLDEAWVTGALEHPNIVPVYDIAVDEEHRPHIVMKRITGIQWAAVMDDAGALPSSAGTRDLLGWNLGILSSVCDAVHFAHSRGVVHRDLKPENVMIGEFGEVYVVDWGIAVAVREGNPRLPVASSGRVAGTPRYMAPEMVAGEPPTFATDVYLLGALLYRILTGQAPHRGWAVREILAAVAEFQPRFPDDVPVELQDLVRAAMQREPSKRLAGADEFRLRLQTFVAHRGSSALAASASHTLTELRVELADRRDRTRVHGLLGACRFGYEQALRAWPENEAARFGLEAAVEAVARFELDERDPRAAALLLGQLSSPDPDLVNAVERLRAERDAEVRALVRLTEDQDPRIGQRTRVFFVAVFGVGWVLVPSVTWIGWSAAPALTEQIAFAVFQVLLVGAFILWARQSMLSTPLNRTTTVLLGLVPGAQLLLHVALWLRGADAWLGVTLEPLVYAIIATAGALLVHRVTGFAALAYVAATLASAWDPEHALLYSAVANAVLTAALLALWYPSMPAGPTHRTS